MKSQMAVFDLTLEKNEMQNKIALSNRAYRAYLKERGSDSYLGNYKKGETFIEIEHYHPKGITVLSV